MNSSHSGIYKEPFSSFSCGSGSLFWTVVLSATTVNQMTFVAALLVTSSHSHGSGACPWFAVSWVRFFCRLGYKQRQWHARLPTTQ